MTWFWAFELRLELARHELEAGVVVAPATFRPRSPARCRCRATVTRAAVVRAVLGGAAGIETDCVRTVIAPITPAGPAGPPRQRTGRPGGALRADWARREAGLARSPSGAATALATFAELTALFLIFGFVTALSLSCGVPTLFLASCVAAAMPVPPSATSSARQATTIAGEGRRKSFLISYPFLVACAARLPR